MNKKNEISSILNLIFQNFDVTISSLLISVIIIWVVTLIHLKGINLVSRINNFGVITEIIGVFMLITFLIYFLYFKLRSGVLSDWCYCQLYLKNDRRWTARRLYDMSMYAWVYALIFKDSWCKLRSGVSPIDAIGTHI